MSTNDKNHYEILQVPQNAGNDAIEEAYQRLASEARPNADSDPEAAARMAELEAAHAVLTDPIARAEYNATLAGAPDEPRGGIVGFFSSATPSRKALFGIGAATFVVGLVLLIVGLMSALGGDDDRAIVEVIDITPTPSRTAPPTQEPTDVAPTPIPAPPLPDAGYTMVINKIGVNGPVQVFGLDANAVPVVPEGDDAADVVAWYNFSARPGTGSNAVFAGHVTWFGPAVFFSLPNLVSGDEITLRGTDGTELIYQVSDVYQVSATDPEAVNVMKSTPDDVLTIITCDGTFTEDPNDHVAGGSYDNRLVVRAALHDVRQPSAVSAGG